MYTYQSHVFVTCVYVCSKYVHGWYSISTCILAERHSIREKLLPIESLWSERMRRQIS